MKDKELKFKLEPVKEKPIEEKMDFSLIPMSKAQYEEDVSRARRYSRRKGYKIDELEKAWVERTQKRKYTVKIR